MICYDKRNPDKSISGQDREPTPLIVLKVKNKVFRVTEMLKKNMESSVDSVRLSKNVLEGWTVNKPCNMTNPLVTWSTFVQDVSSKV